MSAHTPGPKGTWYRIRVHLESQTASGQQRFVCDQNRSWDASYMCLREGDAKLWKTAAGAERWLAERPLVKGIVQELPPDYVRAVYGKREVSR